MNMLSIVLLFGISAEKQKNEHALNVMNRILDNATWINIHWLPVSIKSLTRLYLQLHFMFVILFEQLWP